ncbi:replicative DNA helicase [Variovorax sp. tm]|uniref:replicative DNA helicase n=1 Tax=Variovorax atrisoli TaxID=3394203 RepID=UPI003A805342
MPWSAEAEAGVLGALMLDSACWDRVGDILSAEQFFADHNRRIFNAIGAMVLSVKPVDIITVHEHLQTSGQGEGIDLMMLNEISQSVSSLHAVRRHAEIVAERALMRGLLAAADDVREIAVTAGSPVVERLDKAQARLQELQVHRRRSMPVPVSEMMVGFLDHLSDLSEGRVDPGIPTRIPTLDRMLGGGLMAGKQIVLAARPSIGKSSLAEQICINLAKDGHAAAFLSQEMTNGELLQRAIANAGRIDLGRLITGKLQDHEWERVTEAVELMNTLPLHFDDQPALSLMDIAAKARMLKRQRNIKLLVIDYLQLCASTRSDRSRHHEIEEISRGTKALSKQLGITILLLSQLSREVEKRTSGRPQLSDLKESGAIEEDADVVMLLSRNTKRQDGSQLICCDVPKNRQGRTGEVALHFEGDVQCWSQSTEPLEFKKPPSRHYTEEA